MVDIGSCRSFPKGTAAKARRWPGKVAVKIPAIGALRARSEKPPSVETTGARRIACWADQCRTATPVLGSRINVRLSLSSLPGFSPPKSKRLSSDPAIWSKEPPWVTDFGTA